MQREILYFLQKVEHYPSPRVEDDPVPRRPGMRFPDFWRMFFEAFAKAKATPGPWNG